MNMVIEDMHITEEKLLRIKESIEELLKKQLWYGEILSSEISSNPFYPYFIRFQIRLKDNVFSSQDELRGLRSISRKTKCEFRFHVYPKENNLILEVFFYPKEV
jgi:hypothetical protein